MGEGTKIDRNQRETGTGSVLSRCFPDQDNGKKYTVPCLKWLDGQEMGLL